jgi:hypothetical protein
MDLGALTFVLGSIKQTFQLSTAEALNGGGGGG